MLWNSKINSKTGFRILSLLIVILISGCKEDNTTVPSDYVPLKFISITADTTTLIPGGSTKLYATAEGTGLEYFWSASSGNIAGSGKEVTYLAPPCTLGDNTIECTVKDCKDLSDTKTIIIHVE